MAVQWVKHPNGSRSTARKLPKGSRARSLTTLRDRPISTVTSYTNPRHAGTSSINTRGVTASMARSQVFNTNELLTHILAFLPVEDLLTVQQVNRHWKQLIQTPRLKLKMFLRQEKNSPVLKFDKQKQSVTEAKGKAFQSMKPTTSPQPEFVVPSLLNTAILKENTRLSNKSLWYRAKYCGCGDYLLFKHAPKLRPSKSAVLDMFVAQPPPRQVRFDIVYHFGQRYGPRGRLFKRNAQATISSSGGVKLRDILCKFYAMAKAPSGYGVKLEDIKIDRKESYLFMPPHIFPTGTEFDAVMKQ